MTESQDPAEPTPRVQRRRLQFGTGCPHRGPAPACRQRQIRYRPPQAGARSPPGGLRVLQIQRP